MDTSVAVQLARYLLQIKAIQFNTQTPFIWTSGWRSPIYCDNRKLLSYPEVRNFVKKNMSALVKKEFPASTCIAGVATAGIPIGALIADILELPFIYVRAKPKEHGLRNTIEGELKPGAHIVVVEDTVSSGKSSLQAVEDLRNNNAVVDGMVAIYNYAFPVTANRFKDNDVPLFSLCTYDELLEAALELGFIPKDALQSLTDWRQDPANWKNESK